MPNARHLYCLLLVAIAAGCAPPTNSGESPSPRAAPFDVILRGGSVLDGTGRPAYRADVGVAGARIAKVGDLSRDSAATVIDVSGLVVAPGFINLHSHASPQALPTAANMLRQGVTTELMNADGGGPLDIAPRLAAADSGALAVNIGVYAPFNSAWASVVGNTDRRPTATELTQVTALLERGLEAGAWGVSAGLDYKPAYYATTDEVVAVLSPLRAWRTNFPNHDRLTPEAAFSSLAAMRETIEIGERAGLVPVITHMKLQGKEQGRADSALAMMRAATARGVYTAADVYPYLAGQTALAALFIPGWAQEGGRDAFLQRLRDSSVRARVVRETEEALVARVGGPSNVYVIGRNKTVAQIMTEMGTPSTGDAIVRILEVDSPGMIATFGAEPDLVKIIQYPDAAISCDCGASRNAAHPRYFGTFPRVLGHYARESRSLALAEAVRKMTGLPATLIGMVDRGFVAPGMAADLTVFDAATVLDHATYERPMELPQGIRLVMVNGRVALRDGEPTGVAGGRTLRRTRAMISRQMSISSSRELRVEAADSGTTTAAAISAEPPVGITSSRIATRSLRLDLARRQLRVSGGGTQWDGIEFGLLQTAPRWATVTGRLRDSVTREELGFALIVDDGDGSVTLCVDNRPPYVLRRREAGGPVQPRPR